MNEAGGIRCVFGFHLFAVPLDRPARAYGDDEPEYSLDDVKPELES